MGRRDRHPRSTHPVRAVSRPVRARHRTANAARPSGMDRAHQYLGYRRNRDRRRRVPEVAQDGGSATTRPTTLDWYPGTAMTPPTTHYLSRIPGSASYSRALGGRSDHAQITLRISSHYQGTETTCGTQPDQRLCAGQGCIIRVFVTALSHPSHAPTCEALDDHDIKGSGLRARLHEPPDARPTSRRAHGCGRPARGHLRRQDLWSEVRPEGSRRAPTDSTRG